MSTPNPTHIIAEGMREVATAGTRDDGQLWGAFPNTMTLTDLAAHVVSKLTDAGYSIVPTLPVLADADALYGLLEHFNFDLGNGDSIPVETANGHCWFAYPTEDGGDFGVAMLAQDPRETMHEDEGGYPTYPRIYPDDPIITYPLRVLWLPAAAAEGEKP